MERWQIEGTDLSLEYQTERTPTRSKYYLYRGDQLIAAFEDRRTGLAAYHQVRQEVWEGWLASNDPELRLAGARGLWRQEKENPKVLAILWRDGTPQDRVSVCQPFRPRRGARPHP